MMWFHASGWLQGLNEDLSSTLLYPFWWEKNWQNRGIKFQNSTGFHAVFANESFAYSDVESSAHVLSTKSGLGFLSVMNSITIVWINFCRFYYLTPSITQLLLISSISFSIILSFAPQVFGQNFSIFSQSGDSISATNPEMSEGISMNDILTIGRGAQRRADLHYVAFDNEQLDHSINCSSADFNCNAMMGSFDNYAVHQKNDKHLFCLETACFLLECSWQTYFNSDENEVVCKNFLSINGTVENIFRQKNLSISEGRDSLDTFGAAIKSEPIDLNTSSTKMLDDENMPFRNLEQLNAKEILNIESKEMGILCYVAVRTECNTVVVAFRGTHNLQNAKTDLSFQQTIMPNFEIAGDILLETLFSDALLQHHDIATNKNKESEKDHHVDHGDGRITKMLRIASRISQEICSV
jgi:hypothetical protein